MSTRLPPISALRLDEDEPAAVAMYAAGASLGPRRLCSYEIVLIVAGSADLWLDGRHHALVPGSCVLARPGMVDSYLWDPGRSSRHYFLHFHIAGPIDATDWPIVRHWPMAVAIAPVFRQLVWLASNDGEPERSELMRGFLWVLLSSFITGATEGAVAPNPGGDPLRSALEYVRRRWEMEGFTLITRAELAEAADVSVAHLSRCFTAKYGVGPAKGLEWVRLLRTVALLERSSMTIGQIAGSCGFADAYHFSHRFRSAYDTSPSQYRQLDPGERPRPPALPAIFRLEQELLSADRAQPPTVAPTD